MYPRDKGLRGSLTLKSVAGDLGDIGEAPGGEMLRRTAGSSVIVGVRYLEMAFLDLGVESEWNHGSLGLCGWEW